MSKEEGMTPEEEAMDITAHDNGGPTLADLSDDDFGSSQDSTDDGGSDDAEERGDATDAVDVLASGDGPVGPQDTKEPKFKLHDGKEVTWSKLTPELVTKLVTQANQVAHHQELYQKQKQAADELEKKHQELLNQVTQAQLLKLQQPQAEQQQQQQSEWQPIQPMDKDSVRKTYAPRVKEAIAAGRLDPDFVSDYPGMAEELYHLVDFQVAATAQQLLMQQQQVAQALMGRVQPLSEQAEEIRTRTMKERTRALFVDASNDSGFESLKDPEEQKKLFNYIKKQCVGTMQKDNKGNVIQGTGWNPILNKEFLQAQYLAMVGPEIIKGGRKAVGASKASQAVSTRMSSGPRSGGRPGAPVRRAGEPTPEEDAMLFHDPRAAF